MAALRPVHDEALTAAARGQVQAFGARPWSEDYYLAGSAALALFLGHRSVRDLDLMSRGRRLAAAERRDLLADLSALDPELKVETARDGYLYVRGHHGVALRFYYYPYDLVAPATMHRGLSVASPVDLGLMKLGAIISRGTTRDFVDLYLLCRHVSLDELLARSAAKFDRVRDFPLQALKGLADLGLVPGEPMPELTEPLEWATVEEWLAAEVRRLGRPLVGLERESAT